MPLVLRSAGCNLKSMTRPALVDEILDLPAEDRLQLVEKIWDSLAVSAESVPVPDWHKSELNDRLDDSSEKAISSWEEVQARLRQPKR